MTTEELRVECDRGAPGACFLLAGRYKLGTPDTPKDPAQSVHYHERSCELGVTEGCVQLGYLYVKGSGVPADPARAFALFNDACNAQHANGCDSLGEAYEKGWGTAVDPQKAQDSYAKACQLDAKLCR
jgi:TPR repeat protein